MPITEYQNNVMQHSTKKWDKADWGGILLILALWLSMSALADPIGDFPLNDDWAYAASVKTLIDTGHFVFPDWSAANVFIQIIWGALFSSVFGHSFTVLRISTLVLGLIGLIAIYRLLREMHASNGVSILGTIAVAVNPVFFASSNTFMTEVPFFSFSLMALFFLTKALRNDNFYDVFLGATAAVLALLIRQLGFAIPIAFAFAYLIGNRISPARIIKAALPLVACLIAHSSFKEWLRLDGQTPTMYGYQIQQIEHMFSQSVWTIVARYSHNMFYAFTYLCLFALPILLLIAFNRGFVLNWRKVGLFLAISVFMWMCLRYIETPSWPLLGNTLSQNGIGPMLQHGSAGYQPYLAMHVELFWRLISFLSIMSVVLMIFVLRWQWASVWFYVKAKNILVMRPMIFFGATTIVYLLPVGGVDYLFDRYLIFPIVTTILFCLSLPVVRPTSCSSRLGAVSALSIIIVMGMITVSVTHDYLSWNRARWLALNNLVYEKKIAPARIDGGFEFNGLYLYNSKQTKPNALGWWVVDNEYLIAYAKGRLIQKEGYKEVSHYDVHSWLPYSPQAIYVLQKK